MARVATAGVLFVSVVLAGCAGSPGAVSTRERVDDVLINFRVKEVIFADPVFKAASIDVTTRAGVVRLVGRVDRADDVARATRTTHRVRGVSSVTNELVATRP